MIDEVRIVSTDSLTTASKTPLLTSHIVPKHSVTAYVVIVICLQSLRLRRTLSGLASLPFPMVKYFEINLKLPNESLHRSNDGQSENVPESDSWRKGEKGWG